jgi:hypothetical protein
MQPFPYQDRVTISFPEISIGNAAQADRLHESCLARARSIGMPRIAERALDIHG